MILRVAHSCECEYESRPHERLAQAAGLARADVERSREARSAEGWSERQRALLWAADELASTGARVGVAYFGEPDTDMSRVGFGTEAAAAITRGPQYVAPLGSVSTRLSGGSSGAPDGSRRPGMSRRCSPRGWWPSGSSISWLAAGLTGFLRSPATNTRR